MTRHNCPECGDPLVPTTDEGIGMCINCQWRGDLDDPAPETTSPLDVTARQGEVVFDIKIAKRGWTDRKSIRLSPDSARNFAEALEVAADDAERRDDGGGGSGGFDDPHPPTGGEQR